MTPNGRPTTPAEQQKSGVICKFFLSTGQCLRSDCRFSHDLSSHICKVRTSAVSFLAQESPCAFFSHADQLHL